jgi:16S rRNA (guanine527-N7)-methyltransferase
VAQHRQTPAAANDRRRERLPDGPVHDQMEGALDRPRGPLPTCVQDLEPLPPGFDETLDAGLAALGIALDPDARAAIDAHARFLLAWTGSINLTAIRDPADVARLHVLDSLAAAPALATRGLGRLLDIGSGGGFPGLPLAAALGVDRALLVDSVGKKVRFLRTVIDATGLERRVAAEHARVEALAHDPRDRGAWAAVTARAVSSLAELVELGLPLVAPGGVLIAWKRDPVEAELAAAGGALAALRAGEVIVERCAVPGLETHRLVIVPRGGDIDARFPRDPAERRRRPL